MHLLSQYRRPRRPTGSLQGCLAILYNSRSQIPNGQPQIESAKISAAPAAGAQKKRPANPSFPKLARSKKPGARGAAGQQVSWSFMHGSFSQTQPGGFGTTEGQADKKARTLADFALNPNVAIVHFHQFFDNG